VSTEKPKTEQERADRLRLASRSAEYLAEEVTACGELLAAERAKALSEELYALAKDAEPTKEIKM